MSKFKQFIIKSNLNEAKVLSFSYSEKIKNFGELHKYLNNWKSEDYSFDKISNKVIEVYFAKVNFIGEIKDKGKKFEITGKLINEKEVVDYIKKGVF